MKVPMSWLRVYTNLDESMDIKAFTDGMTMSGSKVEGVEFLGEGIAKIVVGRILEISPHPNADKLVITKVDTGGAPLQIVTGADNLYPGAYVPVATDGAVLAGGQKIKKGKLRGELSEGMLCSIEELGYTTHDYPEAPAHGIYIFTEEQPLSLGADVRPILALCDDVVEFELTSNRPDCYSVTGLAREAAATFGKTFTPPPSAVEENAEGDIGGMIAVDIRNPELCPRYIARVIKNVKIEPSPLWMRHRLTAAGVRPINNIVDITNYVMLELGQPMHAFDIDCIEGGTIIVRNAEEGESFTTLDGAQHTLDASMLVIADINRAVALAGVMGGENSMITGTADAVLFEAANFKGSNVRITAKKLGLRTESSAKFEKGLDPNLPLEAVNRAAALVEELGCGEVVRGAVDCYPNPRLPRTVSYSPERVNALLGSDISAQAMEEILSSLEIPAANGVARVPTFRDDIRCEADIAEEVARLYGYGNIPGTLTSGTPTVGRKSREQHLEELVKETAMECGYSEALTYAFESPRVFDKLMLPEDSPLRQAITLSNPLGEDYSAMRTTTVNGILAALASNYNKRNETAALFEVAKKYIPESLPMKALPEEIQELTAGFYGEGDFYTLKGLAEALGERCGMVFEYRPETRLSFMHPGRTARVLLDGAEIGFLGEVHPAVLENYCVGAGVYLASLELERVYAKAELTRAYRPVPRFPAVKRDLALLVGNGVLAGDIERVIKSTGGKLLEETRLFDVYTGTGLPEGQISMAYSCSFRAADRTLTDGEAADIIKGILGALDAELGVRLRDA